MDWLDNITNKDLKSEIQNNNDLIRKIHVLIPMTATQIKLAKKSLLKGISIRISEELLKCGIINESQNNRIKRMKSFNKKGNKKKL